MTTYKLKFVFGNGLFQETFTNSGEEYMKYLGCKEICQSLCAIPEKEGEDVRTRYLCEKMSQIPSKSIECPYSIEDIASIKACAERNHPEL